MPPVAHRGNSWQG